MFLVAFHQTILDTLVSRNLYIHHVGKLAENFFPCNMDYQFCTWPRSFWWLGMWVWSWKLDFLKRTLLLQLNFVKENPLTYIKYHYYWLLLELLRQFICFIKTTKICKSKYVLKIFLWSKPSKLFGFNSNLNCKKQCRFWLKVLKSQWL